jgi:hypothetical protein
VTEKTLILTLCGSNRFEPLFKAWNTELSLAGHVVFSIAAYPSDQAGKNWYTTEQKRVLDAVHKRKISLSDGIIVLNYGAYMGESTLAELAHADELCIPAYFLESWGVGCGLNGVRSPIDTSTRRSVWCAELLGPPGSWRSRSVQQLERAADLCSGVRS